MGQSGKNMCQGGKPDTGKFHSSYIGMNVCGSAYENGCVVNGTCATAVLFINPRRMRRRVTVLGLSVRPSICLSVRTLI